MSRRWSGNDGSVHRLLAAIGIEVERRNSDFMVDVFKTLGLEYAAANSGSTVLALQESIVNYGGNAVPEFLTCLHEDASVAMAHGYALVAGKPMLVLLHGSIGVQHAAMAIQDAQARRAPVLLVAGNGARLHGAHNARDLARCVRQDLKWDDEPKSIDEFAASAMRAYKIATTPPAGPAPPGSGPIDAGGSVHAAPSGTFCPGADGTSAGRRGSGAGSGRTPGVRAASLDRGVESCPNSGGNAQQLAELAETVQAPVDSAGGLEITTAIRWPARAGAAIVPTWALSLESRSRTHHGWGEMDGGREWIAISASAPFRQDVSGGPEARWSI